MYSIHTVVSVHDCKCFLFSCNEQGVSTVWQANKANVEKIAPYEAAIKRPYFHVKALDQAQLSNWWAYLDYKTKSGTHAATVRLFERCLVPCAAYSGTCFGMHNRSAFMSRLKTPYSRVCPMLAQSMPSIGCIVLVKLFDPVWFYMPHADVSKV